MSELVDWYPPAPANVPPDLARPTRSYRARVVLVLASLVAFVVLYVGLVLGSAYMCYYAFAPQASTRQAMPQRWNARTGRRESDSSFWWVVLGVSSGVLCLFLVKGFFKRQRADTSLRLEISEKDQPVLFAFIRRLCRDARAPFPHRVFLTPEVNAGVFYNSSILSLFLPARKNLVLGLGLINQLNLSEFKAVLAHEFGHFSQNSMKLGNYVYVSNRILAEIVYGRDWLDDVIAQVRNVDIRIAVFAWAFTGVLWGVRKALQGIFQITNFANSALSRQMEFNADLVAASLTGSDALIHALARLEFANTALMQAWRDLIAAGDHQLYTRDLFYHQTKAADYLRRLSKDTRLGEPPPLPDDPNQAGQVFQPGDHGVPLMWATHPSNFDREQNVKRRYLRSPIAEQPAWVLIQDAVLAREQVTRRFYQIVRPGQKIALADPEVVQAFIDDEHAEMTYHPRYHGMFDRRFIKPGSLDGLLAAAVSEGDDGDRLAQAQASLFGDDLKARMTQYNARLDESNLLAGLVDGSLKLTGKELCFREGRYRAADAGRLLKQVRDELDQDNAWLAEWDRQFLIVHCQMARQVDQAASRELVNRYRFHLGLQELFSNLSAQQHQVQHMLGQLGGERQISQESFRYALGVLQGAHQALSASLDKADSLPLPALKNMTPGQPLGQFLWSGSVIHQLSGQENSLDGQWINSFMQQLGEVLDKVQRIYVKSLGAILALQERISEEWSARHGAVT